MADRELNRRVRQWIESASVEEVMAFRATDHFIGKTQQQRDAALPVWLVETGRIKSDGVDRSAVTMVTTLKLGRQN